MAEESSIAEGPVLVTGASGFIGGRLAERLAVERGARVTGTGRDFSRSGHLEEAGVELVRADLRDSDRMGGLVEDREVVFHVAAWMGGEGGAGTARAVNVDAAEALARRAADAGVRRFVHVSTIGVHGPPDRPVMDESAALDTEQSSAYGRTKALGERAVRAVGRETGLEVAVARPSYVYGPGSTGWTIGIYKMACGPLPALVGDGGGHFYPAYVDNVVDALLLCAGREAAAGEAFLVSDPPVPWRAYVEAHAGLCGRSPGSVPLWMAKVAARIGDLPFVPLPLDSHRLAFLTSRSRYSTGKARSELGWEPRVGLEEGLERSLRWLREAYLGR